MIVFSPPFLLEEDLLKEKLKDIPNLIVQVDFMTDSIPVQKIMNKDSFLIIVTSRYQHPPP